MNQTIRSIVRQVTPPILLPLGKAIIYGKRKPSANELLQQKAAAELKVTYDQRNTHAGENEIVFRDGLTMMLHPDSMDPIEHFCYRSPVLVEEMNCFIERSKNKKKLLDIGALHGVFSLVFAASSPSKTAVAVDASPVAFARLLYNIHKNKFNNITPVECALSDVSGTLRMHYEWEHAVAAETGDANEKYLSVAKRTGDELCEQLGFEPDVVKIDVEGHEVKVVKGLSKLITRLRPLVFLELHPGRIAQEKDTIEELLRVFVASGYQACLVDGRAFQLQEVAQFSDDQRLVLTPA